jgi:hypothetical protein
MKKSLAKAARKCQILLQDINTIRLQNSILTSSNKEFRSASDNGSYPELALRASLNPNTFSIFRRHKSYTPILEHVNPQQGAEYLKIIQEDYDLSAQEVMDIILPLQWIGQPILQKIKGLKKPVSTTALRYLKVALDIKAQRGAQLGHVVEIGCGYGGQAVILDRVANIESYTFIDLWQVNMLIQRFIEASPLSCKYSISTLRQASRQRDSWNLAISNYAFSELPKGLQQNYLEEIILPSKHGYLTMNSGAEGCFGSIENMSLAELQETLSNSSRQEERPLTYFKNYILTW